MSTSTFSYAQAAKGQSAAQAATTTAQQSPNPSQTASVAGNQSRDVTTTSNSTRAPSVAVSISSNDVDSSHSARSTSTKPETSRSRATEANQDDANTAVSIAGSVSSYRAGTDMPSSDGATKGTEPRGRSINPSSETDDHNEGKKGKKPKKAKSAEKDAETGQEGEKEGPAPKIELSEAPLPSVNVWVQRQQAAKAKTIDLPANSGANPSQTQASGDSKARSPHNEAMDSNKITFNGKQGSKRDGEPSPRGANQGPRRTAPRGARAHEKEAEINMLANNPASWPTPETAAVNLKTQPQTQLEKPEKEDKEEAGAAKPKQKKEWVQLPNFVPTVKFETALPGRGPRGGRVGGARGGRDTATSHHTANSTERAQDSNVASRTNTTSKRPSVEGSGPREGRKNITHAEHSRLPKETASDNTTSEQLKLNQPGVVNGSNSEQTRQAPAPSPQTDENPKSSDSHKDIRTQNTRDSHPQGQNSANHRNSERTRGGGRGRGGFNQNNHNGLSHYTQNPYPNQHHGYAFPSTGPRHATYGNGYPAVSYTFPSQAGPGQRKSANGNRGRGNGRLQAMAPINVPYDANLYPSPNSGMYSYDAGNLLQLAQTQVEYYFSVENCVKDWYLRTHMDSQGFVPIPFIASFNRMRELLVDLNILRQACIDSAVLELVMGGDGVERVRSKEGWDKWVIQDMKLRDPSARHDGPSTWQPFNNGLQHPMMSPHYPVEAPPVFSPTSEHGFANGNYGILPPNTSTINGVNGHARPLESQLSATVPEFSPSATSTFNNFKFASQKNSEDAKIPTKKESNGATSRINGVMHDQPQMSSGGLHTANGVALAHESDGR
ncbi:hypothetical protein NUW58_g5804 [Xylaria curta]|uniref:Uncharacterized protein n=1 Tax=Xylaria curta TaxID=42375 RepID=A0ACC1NZV6_9PEZI|nr:hypothetical protein NUW58_g5804 [Xylaria curta]